jgi:phospholipid transport system transporter-binding protein
MDNVKIMTTERGGKIEGTINFHTVLQLRHLGAELINQLPSISFDFSHVMQCDSSAIALMLSWTRLANSVQKSIQFKNLPQQLLDIATLCGVLSLLNINLQNKE